MTQNIGRRLDFCKMHGCGNDFIMLNGFSQGLPENMNRLAVMLCNRHFGIGADGIIVLCPAAGYDFQMRLFQPDGSEAEMCGNGIRCAALFAQAEGICQGPTMRVLTLAGEIRPQILASEASEPGFGMVRVNMGRPRLLGAEVPCTLGQGQVLDEPVEVDGREFRLSAISMGNPHGVIFLDTAPESFPVGHFGPLLEHHPAFPARANIEFAQVIDPHTIKMRVWERGVGETLACGTGACACAVAAILTKRAESEVKICLSEGVLRIAWAGQPEDPVYMTGPAEVSFGGSVNLSGQNHIDKEAAL